MEKRINSLERFSNFHSVKYDNHFYLELNSIIESLSYAIKKYAKGAVLDIGCGNKPYENLFTHCEKYIGCDVIQSSQNKADIICTATEIPLKSSSFQTIICTQVIEHVENYNKMISEAFRLLECDGVLILSGPMYWPLHEEPYDFYRFTKHGFKYILEQAGFEIIEIKPNGGKWAMLGQMIIHTFPNWLVNKKWFRILINRTFERFDKKHFDSINTMNYVVIAKKL